MPPTKEPSGRKQGFIPTLWYWWFRLMGWKAVYYEPGIDKYVVIVYPHTSNFDFFIGFTFSRAWPLPFPHFIAKASAFKGPIGALGRAVGGIPVDRSKRTNFVEQVAAEFKAHDKMVLAVTPEGTRSKSPYWKTGFYYMAQAADVPVVMASIDYSKKLITYGEVLYPSGDLEADMELIRQFYAGAVGQHPERQGEIVLRPAEGTAEAQEPPAVAETA
jgi:1-acyl-sn-glycerol-3-phosphate acyltransferase